MSSQDVETSSNITVRVVILTHGERRDEDLFLVTEKDRTVGQFKELIQDNLPQRPAPSTQYLIHGGMPLRDENASLRQALRLDNADASLSAASPHVLHLVIRDQSRPAPAPSGAVPPARIHQSGLPHPPMRRMPLQSPPPPNLDLFRAHTEAHLRALGQAPGNHAPFQRDPALHLQNPGQLPGAPYAPLPQVPTNNASPPGLAPDQPPTLPFQSTWPGNHIQEMRRDTPWLQGYTNTATQAEQDLQARLGAQDQQPLDPVLLVNPFQPVREFRSDERAGPDLARYDFHGGGTQNDGPTAQGGVTSNTSSQILPPPMTAPAVPEMRRGLTIPGPPFTTAPPMPFLSSPRPPVPVRVLGPAADTTPILHAPVPTAQPMAWLLSSPSGPQGLVFAPGHGFFSIPPPGPASQRYPDGDSSIQSTETGGATSRNSNTASEPPTTNPAPTQTMTGAQPATRAGDTANNQQQPAPAVQAIAVQDEERPLNREEVNDLLNFFIQRGWLFLRLYLFIFVLSESGTWRRVFMLGAAMIVCTLPRNNPVTRVFTAIRQHIDNLIGPPQLAAQGDRRRGTSRNRRGEGANENQQNAAAGAVPQPRNGRPSRRSRARDGVRTPEENARRLLREHEERNPSVVRDFLYNIEQAVALFLASLIPGLGERHVRAREEARRIVDEVQRRVEEAEQQRQQQLPQPSLEQGVDEQSEITNRPESGEAQTLQGAASSDRDETKSHPSAVTGQGVVTAGSSSAVDRTPPAPSTNTETPTSESQSLRMRHVEAGSSSA